MAEVSKVSEITVDDLIDYIRTPDDAKTRSELSTLLAAAKSFVCSYTGLTDVEMDNYSEIVIAVHIIVQDWYDNRTLYAQKGDVSPTVQTILDMHARNLI